MLEQEPRVRQVKRPPLVVAQRRSQSISLPQLDEILLSCRERLSKSLGTLFDVALDPDTPRRRSDGPCHGPSELALSRFRRPGSLHPPGDSTRADNALFKKIIQPRQTALFGRRAIREYNWVPTHSEVFMAVTFLRGAAFKAEQPSSVTCLWPVGTATRTCGGEFPACRIKYVERPGMKPNVLGTP